MSKYVNPPTIAKPFGGYSHYCDIAPGSRQIQIAGQVGADPDGSVPEAVEEQCALAFANLRAVLHHAEMDVGDITKLSVFLTDLAHIGAYRNARQQALGDLMPPTTLLVVSSLANRAWKVEIEAFAAKAS